MIAQFIKVLREAGFEPTAREIADMLYLAMKLGVPDSSPDRGAKPKAKTEPRIPEPSSDTSTAGQQPPTLAAQKDPQPGDLFLPSAAQAGSGGTGVRAAPFRAPTATALPGAGGIARALRPLRRRYPSRNRFILDEEETVRMIGNGGPLAAVLKPAEERWLELTLVIDEGAAMRVWRPMLKELQRLTERMGAFRDVHVWGLEVDDGTVRLYREIGLPNAPRRLRNPRELIDPSGRRLIMVVSDCTALGWRNGAAFRLLARLGRVGPVVLVQVLPQRLWSSTALPQVDALLRALVPGVPNHMLTVERDWLSEAMLQLERSSDPKARDGSQQTSATQESPLPVVMLEGWALAPWARVLAGVGGASAAGIVIPYTPSLAGETPAADSAQPPARPITSEQADALNTVTAEERVSQFRAAASPPAYQLACYLASAPLSLPVMRLVQQSMMPASTQVHLAEVYLGGLMYQLPAPASTALQPDELLFEFYDGVREILRKSVSPRETLRVLTEVSNLVEERLALEGGFGALVVQPGAREEYVLDSTSLAFAHLGAQILRQFGGHEESVAHLEQMAQTRSPAPGKEAPHISGPGLEAEKLPEPAEQRVELGDDEPTETKTSTQPQVDISTQPTTRSSSQPQPRRSAPAVRICVLHQL